MNKVTLIFVLTLIPFNAYANCIGKIDRVQVTGTGAIEIISTPLYGNATGRQVCNMSTSWKGVTPEACRGWYSLILSAIAQDREIKMQFPTGQTCSTQSSWSGANPPHMISNKEI